MSKVLPATCVAGVVTADEIVLPGAEILGDGVGQSDGIAILDEDESFYVPNSTPDLATTLQNVSDALGQVVTALTHVTNSLTLLDTHGFLANPGPSPSPPLCVTEILAVTTAATAITAAQTALDTLAEALI